MHGLNMEMQHRASIALGEKPSAQVSRESLQAAQQQADIMKGGLHSSEVEFLEDQQRHLQRQREFKQAAESAVKLKAPPAVPLIPQRKPGTFGPGLWGLDLFSALAL